MEAFLKSFVSLFVAIDAIGALPFLLGLTRGLSDIERRKLVYRASASAFAVGLIFLIAGRGIFKFLGIWESDFRIAGGLLLIVFAIRDLLVTSSHQGAPTPTRVGIVPIAIPLMMGPAALATIMVGTEQFGSLVVGLSLALNLLIVLVIFSNAGWIMRKLGDDVSDAVNKIFSLLIAAIGVMLVRSGFQQLGLVLQGM